MRPALLLLVSILAEVIGWIPLALGFIVGVIVAAAVYGYQVGRGL